MDTELEQAFAEQNSPREERTDISKPCLVTERGHTIPMMCVEHNSAIEMEMKQCLLREVIGDVAAIWFKFIRYREGDEFHIGEFKNWLEDNEEEIEPIQTHPMIRHNFDYANIKVTAHDILLALVVTGVLKSENGVGQIGRYMSFNVDNDFNIKQP